MTSIELKWSISPQAVGSKMMDTKRVLAMSARRVLKQADAEAQAARCEMQRLGAQAEGLRSALQAAHDRHHHQLQRCERAPSVQKAICHWFHVI